MIKGDQKNTEQYTFNNIPNFIQILWARNFTKEN